MKKEAVPDRIMTHSTMNSPSPGLLSYWERISAPKGQRPELHAAATPSTTFNQPIAAVPPTIPPCACSAQFRRARPAGPLRLVTPELHGFAVAYPLLGCASHRVLSAVALPDQVRRAVGKMARVSKTKPNAAWPLALGREKVSDGAKVQKPSASSLYQAHVQPECARHASESRGRRYPLFQQRWSFANARILRER